VGRRLMGQVAVAGLLALAWGMVDRAAAQLVISEFRLRGLNGANDEYVEIYNPAPTAHTVTSSDGSLGYALATSSGIRFIIQNGTVIPPHGHFLGINTVGYSIGGYPAGVSSTAFGDATFTTDIPDNAGIALFSTTNSANFSVATRIDAVGSTSEANTLYKEGTGYPALTPFSIDYAWYRDMATGNAKDTDSNASDFLFVDTNGTSAGGGQRLGAPGPKNSTSPVGTTGLAVNLLDPSVPATSPPNFVRDFTSDPANNSTFGTVTIRRTITNGTGAALTRLRFRVSEITTFPSPSSISDLRPRTSAGTSVIVSGAPVTVLGTTLEQPPSQPNGGGFNSSMSPTLGTLLLPGDSVSLQFRFGIQQTGQLRICGNLEALPGGGGALGQVGNTDSGGSGSPCTRTQPFGPLNTAPPAVTPSGQPGAGTELTALLGTWVAPGAITYGMQWRRCNGACSDIAGAVNDTYTPGFDDVGKTLLVRVTATGSGGSVSADSVATGTVIDGTAPALTASTDGAVKKGVVSTILGCPSTEILCSGTVRFTASIKKKKRVEELELGSAPFATAGNTSTTVAVSLSKRGKSLLKRKRHLSAMMIVDVRDAAGNPATIAESVTLQKQK
jgi:hypothetical protein